MTALYERLDEAALLETEETSWRVASAQGQFTHMPGVQCHLYPYPGSRQAVCGFLPFAWALPLLYHEPGPCPNGHPLCPVCYPEVMLDENAEHMRPLRDGHAA